MKRELSKREYRYEEITKGHQREERDMKVAMGIGTMGM